jgi:hypothetical protein
VGHGQHDNLIEALTPRPPINHGLGGLLYLHLPKSPLPPVKTHFRDIMIRHISDINCRCPLLVDPNLLFVVYRLRFIL